MNYFLTDNLLSSLQASKPEVRDRFTAIIELWHKSPFHPRFRFVQYHRDIPLCYMRIQLDWWAFGVRDKSDVTWFWIGTHQEFSTFISNLTTIQCDEKE